MNVTNAFWSTEMGFFYAVGDCWQPPRLSFVCHSLPPVCCFVCELTSLRWRTSESHRMDSSLGNSGSGWTAFLLPHSSVSRLSVLRRITWLDWTCFYKRVCSLSFHITLSDPHFLSYKFPSSTTLCLSYQRDVKLLNLLRWSKMLYFEPI